MLANAIEHSSRVRLNEVLEILQQSELYPTGLPDCVIEIDEGGMQRSLVVRYTHPEKVRCMRSAIDLTFRVTLDTLTGAFIFMCDKLVDNRHWNAILADCSATLCSDVSKVSDVLKHLRWHLGVQLAQDVARELPLRLHRLAPISVDAVEEARERREPHLNLQLIDYPQYYLHLTFGHDGGIEYRLHATDALEWTCVLPTARHTMELRDLRGPFPPKRRRVALHDHDVALGGSPREAAPGVFDELQSVTSLCLERVPRIEVAQQLQAHDIMHSFSLSSSNGTFIALPAIGSAATLASLVTANMFAVEDDGVQMQIEFAKAFPADMVPPNVEGDSSREVFDPEKLVVTLPKLPCSTFADDFLAFWRGASVLFRIATGLVAESAEAARKGHRASVRYRFSTIRVVMEGPDDYPNSTVEVQHGVGGLALVLPKGSPFLLVERQLRSDFAEGNHPLLALSRSARGLGAITALVSSCRNVFFDAWSSTAGELRGTSKQAARVAISFYTEDTVVVSGDEYPGLPDFFRQGAHGGGDVRTTCSGSVAVPIAVFEATCRSVDGAAPALVRHMAAWQVWSAATAALKNVMALDIPVRAAEPAGEGDTLRFALTRTASTLVLTRSADLMGVGAAIEATAIQANIVAALVTLFQRQVESSLDQPANAVAAFLHLVSAPSELVHDLGAAVETTLVPSGDGHPTISLELVAPPEVDNNFVSPRLGGRGVGFVVEYGEGSGGEVVVRLILRIDRGDATTYLAVSFVPARRHCECGWGGPALAVPPEFERLRAAFAATGSVAAALKGLLE
mmetsp:Transcript_21021/g.62550  ORF Transcript_21021/g.62550 Transcript_21021/m.62550 type:complete len:795 (-) Transcript_21021:119-2503(-)